MYLIVKQIHIILVIISVSLFQLRYWRFKYPNHKPSRLYKIAPHLIDTLLLTSGVFLAWLAGFSPFHVGWFGIKLLAVLSYIILGFVAMKTTGVKQWLAYVLASFTVLYVMLVAHFKTPTPLP
ncbi:SirB2 family protein [Marinicella sp. S1101]|uniref:SirB2 family protein n=1 Tax=Marinicella marina TaxID=2996016 RepID=UPI002260EAA8|nr:SirB2 family protein [Marinicella marina]MCX7552304.1 SirB2 family protein [Marinicella marina]MDJ1139179.1 SirB2 family protein [Marinicella marina]